MTDDDGKRRHKVMHLPHRRIMELLQGWGRGEAVVRIADESLPEGTRIIAMFPQPEYGGLMLLLENTAWPVLEDGEPARVMMPTFERVQLEDIMVENVKAKATSDIKGAS